MGQGEQVPEEPKLGIQLIDQMVCVAGVVLSPLTAINYAYEICTGLTVFDMLGCIADNMIIMVIALGLFGGIFCFGNFTEEVIETSTEILVSLDNSLVEWDTFVCGLGFAMSSTIGIAHAVQSCFGTGVIDAIMCLILDGLLTALPMIITSNLYC
jgi:hypothetical protein